MRGLALAVLLFSSMATEAKPRPCVGTAEAEQYLNKDICISAHIYEVVRLPDGTRFLDVCPPEVPDGACRFTILSLRQDWNEVGELEKYRNADVHLRGVVEPIHGRAGMVLSHARQFYGGPPKFKPNPRLIQGFGGEMERPPASDPNLRPHGGRRSFMNTRDQETLPGK